LHEHLGADLPDRAFIRRLERKLRAEAGEGPPALAQMSRRTLLRTAGAAAAALVVGAVAEHQVGLPHLPTTSPDLVPNGGAWVPVAAVSEVPDGEAKRFATGSVEGVVVNDGGEIRALSAVCTHLGCLLKPDPAARQLDCPCHRTAFSWSGKVLYYQLKTAPAALPRILSRVRAGQVEVYVV